MNEAIAAFKALPWGRFGRGMVREGKVVAKAIAGTGVKGYYLPTAIGAVAGGGIAYGNRALDGTNGSRGTSASVLKGALIGAGLGAGYRAGRNFSTGGGGGAVARMARSSNRMGGLLRGRVGRPLAASAVGMAGRGYGAAQAAGSIGMDYARSGYAAASSRARSVGASGLRYAADMVDRMADRTSRMGAQMNLF